MDTKLIAEYKGKYVKIKLSDGTTVRGILEDVQKHVIRVDGKYVQAGHVIVIEEVATA